jgi:hypothetical protein
MQTALYIDLVFLEEAAMHLARAHAARSGTRQAPTLSRVASTILAMAGLDRLDEVHVFGPVGRPVGGFTEVDAQVGGARVQRHRAADVPAALAASVSEAAGSTRVILVADDPAYPTLLRAADVSILIRLENATSTMPQLYRDRWQDIDYVLGYAMGIPAHLL